MSKVYHSAGFFSCCSVKLNKIVDYFNDKKILPKEIQNNLFNLYKPKGVTDVTYHYFMKPLDSVEIPYIKKIDYHHKYQYINYKNLNFQALNPFIAKYFSPSQEIVQILNTLVNKYSVNFSNCCAVYYRGTDKFIETNTGDFQTYITKMEELYTKDPSISFILQSDNQNFIEAVQMKFPNAIVFDENKTSYKKRGIHFENTPEDNYTIQKYFLAICILISKCKYIIMSSGNCSIWMVFFRGNANNVIQFYSNKWYEGFQLREGKRRQFIYQGLIGVK
jgi:hypothetical protein